MIVIDVKQKLGELDMDIKLELPMQGITAIFGRSGAGKTSLINVLSGLSKPDSGSISLGQHVLYSQQAGINLPPEKRRIGYVFQDARLFPHYTVEGNLLYGCKSEKSDQFHSVTHLLGIEHLLKRYPASLSGGEKQRVAIGRALLSNPSLLLMDEPLASLDLPRKQELMPYLERLAKEVKIPIVYVTHSLDEILRLADHMAMIHHGKVVVSGHINSVWGSPEMRPWLPAKEQSSLLSARINHHHPHYGLTQVMLNHDAYLWVNRLQSVRGEWVRVRVHSNDVSLTKAKPEQTSIRNILAAKIDKIHPVDEQERVEVRLRVGEAQLWANITKWAADELHLSVGDKVFAQIKGVSVTQEDLASM
ncbi:molybdenum ABC transporter ATP-binding protein ModC [Photobacterium gaetbulicola]|uniref:Molybdate transporter ATP-binding protein n=1 Tax=Photobacterium gaetbulicola Gung47 TaxID=658445 RepID=A0A0C5WLS1_9GAMM|nr:molybdenum ABC transporter ATP-binding protein ModC [Photobacterium gaetbulicola]AJR06059.1 molybdate transporter ATP-binding protein [Photobacterium gaetbulicola Gung47]PSU13140.1 molybdenum ABC transporter ATP-binding protein ModC [Photobacterium gaetbulicola]